MKKLGKLNLNEFSQISDREMKQIVGGVGPYDPNYKPGCGSGPGQSCSGVCGDTWDDATKRLVGQKCSSCICVKS